MVPLVSRKNSFSSKPKNEKEKIETVVGIFNQLEIKKHAGFVKNKYLDLAYFHLDKIDVADKRKLCLKQLAQMLVHRDI